MIIHSKRIVTEMGIQSGYLVVENGIIQDILDESADVKADLDVQNNRIIPGIFDTHNHGTMGYGLWGCAQPEQEVRGYLKGLASQGVTLILPTADISMFKAIAKVAKEEGIGAKVAGIHSEGPYLNRVGEKGIDNGHPDIDLNYLSKMIEEAEGLLKLVAIAPELPVSQKAVDYLVSNGIKVAYAHSNCNYEEAMEAFNHGISVSTHTANVMSGIHHRNMGGLGACLLNKEVDCEVICDGLHVGLPMLEIMFAVKDLNKFMMVSDCTPMSGAPTGRYKMSLVGEVNITEEGFCLSDTGRLCGSTKPVLYGIKTLVEKLQMPLETVSQMASLNPCKVYGWADRKGSIAKGKDADFVIISDNYQAIATYSEGKEVYNQKEGDVFNPEYLKGNLIQEGEKN